MESPYTCPNGRCRSFEPFAAAHRCDRLDHKAVAEPARRQMVFVASDQAVVDSHGDVVQLAGLTIELPLPLQVDHVPAQRVGTVHELYVQPAEGGAVLLGFAGVGEGEREDAAWRDILADKLAGISIGLRGVERNGAVVERAIVPEVSLVPRGACLTARVLVASECLRAEDAKEALTSWFRWRAKQRSRDRARAVIEAAEAEQCRAGRIRAQRPALSEAAAAVVAAAEAQEEAEQESRWWWGLRALGWTL